MRINYFDSFDVTKAPFAGAFFMVIIFI